MLLFAVVTVNVPGVLLPELAMVLLDAATEEELATTEELTATLELEALDEELATTDELTTTLELDALDEELTTVLDVVALDTTVLDVVALDATVLDVVALEVVVELIVVELVTVLDVEPLEIVPPELSAAADVQAAPQRAIQAATVSGLLAPPSHVKKLKDCVVSAAKSTAEPLPQEVSILTDDSMATEASTVRALAPPNAAQVFLVINFL